MYTVFPPPLFFLDGSTNFFFRSRILNSLSLLPSLTPLSGPDIACGGTGGGSRDSVMSDLVGSIAWRRFSMRFLSSTSFSFRSSFSACIAMRRSRSSKRYACASDSAFWSSLTSIVRFFSSHSLWCSSARRTPTASTRAMSSSRSLSNCATFSR